MAALNRGIERLLSPILNQLIDRENYGLTGMRLHFVAFKRAPIAIDFQINLTRLAANLFVVGLLDAAQSDFIAADKTQHMGRQRIVGVVTLRLFARIHAIEIEPIELTRALHLQAANYPDEFLVRVLRVIEFPD